MPTTTPRNALMTVSTYSQTPRGVECVHTRVLQQLEKQASVAKLRGLWKSLQTRPAEPFSPLDLLQRANELAAANRRGAVGVAAGTAGGGAAAAVGGRPSHAPPTSVSAAPSKPTGPLDMARLSDVIASLEKRGAEEDSEPISALRRLLFGGVAGGSGAASVVAAKNPAQELSGLARRVKDIIRVNMISNRKHTPQIGDIVLTSGMKPSDKMMLGELLGGDPTTTHASVVVPQNKRTTRLFDPGSDGMNPRRANPRLSALMHGIVAERELIFKDPRSFFKRLRRRVAKEVERNQRAATTSPKDVLRHESYPTRHVHKLLRNPDLPTSVYRPTTPLTAAEKELMFKNLTRAGNISAGPAAKGGTALKNYFGLGVDKPGTPGLCAGGVCEAYRGIRSMPAADSALSKDLTRLPDFEMVAQSPANRKMLRPVVTSGLTSAGIRAVPAIGLAGMAGASLYQALKN